MITAVAANPEVRRSRTRHQCSAPRRTSSLTNRARKILGRETGFISNSSFVACGADDLQCETELLRRVEQGERVAVANEYTKSLPGHLARLCETPLLSREEEHDLFRRMNFLKYRANSLRATVRPNHADAATLDRIDDHLHRAELIRDHIVRANMRLVMSIVKRFANQKHSFDELLSDGTNSMMKAVDKFDYDRGFRFSTYATRAVTRELYRSIERSHHHRTRFSTNTEESLDYSVDSNSSKHDQRPCDQQLYRSLREMIAKLDDREQLVVAGRFGLDNSGRKSTFVAIGAALGISKERARQLGERAMKKLRGMSREFGLDSFLLED